jgi:hypothetical protein
MHNMKLCQNNKGLLINTITINKIDASNAIEALRATPIVFVGMAIMVAGIPKASRTLAIFEPITFAEASSPTPVVTDLTPTISSGDEVPKATMVKPMINPETPRLFARDAALSTILFPEYTSINIPKNSIVNEISISKF